MPVPSKPMRLVFLESPYAPRTPAPTEPCSCGPTDANACPTCQIVAQRAAEVERHLRYVRAAMADCLHRGEAPFPSHALYTQPGVLRDDVPERRLGIEAGFAWARAAVASVFYVDLGVTDGMRGGQERASHEGRPIEIRRLGGEWA